MAVMQIIKDQRCKFEELFYFLCRSAQGGFLPAVHLHHEGLLDGDPPAVDDHALGVGQVPFVGVLELHGVNHSLSEEDAAEFHVESLNSSGRFFCIVSDYAPNCIYHHAA